MASGSLAEFVKPDCRANRNGRKAWPSAASSSLPQPKGFTERTEGICSHSRYPQTIRILLGFFERSMPLTAPI